MYISCWDQASGRGKVTESHRRSTWRESAQGLLEPSSLSQVPGPPWCHNYNYIVQHMYYPGTHFEELLAMPPISRQVTKVVLVYSTIRLFAFQRYLGIWGSRVDFAHYNGRPQSSAFHQKFHFFALWYFLQCLCSTHHSSFF